MSESPAGKGDQYRSVKRKKFSKNFENIFGKKDIMEYQKDNPNKKGYKNETEKSNYWHDGYDYVKYFSINVFNIAVFKFY